MKYTPKPHPLTFRWAIGSLRDGKKLKHYQTKSQGWGRVMSVLSPKQALDDSTKATRNDTVTHGDTPAATLVIGKFHRPDEKKVQNHACQGCIGNTIWKSKTCKPWKNDVFEDVRCSFWCPLFFSERQSVRLLTAGMLTQKKGLQLLFLFVEFERILYEKSLPSLQGRLCRSFTCCYTSTCRGEITPSGTIYSGPSCTQWFPPQKKHFGFPYLLPPGSAKSILGIVKPLPSGQVARLPIAI